MSLIGNRLDQIVRRMHQLIKHCEEHINTTSDAWNRRLSVDPSHDSGQKSKKRFRQKDEGILLVPAYLAVHLGLNKLLVKAQVRECIFLFY